MSPVIEALGRRARTAPRRVRRLLVIETFLAYPAVILGYRLLAANGAIPLAVWAPLVLFLIVVVEVGGLLVIGAFVGSRANALHPALDERQRALAIRAQAVSYTVLSGAIVATGVCIAMWITFLGPIRLDGALLLPLAVMVGVYLPVLPSAVLAWIEPDVPDDDELPADGDRPPGQAA